MSLTEPIRRPPTWTSSSFTSWPAFSNISVYSWPPVPRNRSSHAASAMTRASATTAAPRAIVIDDPRAPRPRSPSTSVSLHPQRSLRRAGEELAHELVVGVEELVGRAGLHDPALPQHGDVLGDPLRRHDVV